MVCQVTILRVIYFCFCLLFAACQRQTENSLSNTYDHAIIFDHNPAHYSKSQSSPMMNFNIDHEKTESPIPRNRRDLHSNQNRKFHNAEGNKAVHSAFRYNDEIMRFLQSQSSKPFTSERSDFFYNILRPLDRRTIRYGNWDDHSVMHFGKRSVKIEESSNAVKNESDAPENQINMSNVNKRSSPWSDHGVMHFGKRSDEDNLESNANSLNQQHENGPSEDSNEESVQNESSFEIQPVDKKDVDPWHSMMSFGKRYESPWSDHNTMHFGKRNEEPWHSMVSFGKKSSENPWNDHNTMHFGKRDNDPWHSMMSFGKKSDNPWGDHNTMHFGKRTDTDPWHSMMSFGKRSESDPWHSMMSFGKRDDSDPWHSVMSFGKRDNNDPWHNVMSFGKRDNNEPWHNVMSFGKRDNNDPWHSVMSFGKRDSNDPWHSVMSFGKRDSNDPWHNVMSFGKRDNNDPWHSVMSFGKRDNNDPWHNVMSFGKRDNNDPWHSVMSFGKRDNNDPWHSVMSFGKRDNSDPWHNVMSFGKKSENFPAVIQNDESQNNQKQNNELSEDSKQKKSVSDESNENELAPEKRFEMFNDHNTMHFGKKSGAWDSHNTLHFGKKLDPLQFKDETKYEGNFKPEKISGSKHHEKRSIGSKNDLKFMDQSKHLDSNDPQKDMVNENSHTGKNPTVKSEESKVFSEKYINLKKRSVNTDIKVKNSLKGKNEFKNVWYHPDLKTKSIKDVIDLKNKQKLSTTFLVPNNQTSASNKVEIPSNTEISISDKKPVFNHNLSEKNNTILSIIKRSVEFPTKQITNYNPNFQLNSLEEPQTDSVLHFGKRSIEYNEIENEKLLETPNTKEVIQITKKYDAPWETHDTMMHFGKKSDSWDSHNTMHFGKKSDPWESHTMHFGKKSYPWESHTMHFGKKLDPWESQTLHFGKKSDPWESQTLHFGKKSDPWESQTLHFGKKSDPWESQTMHFGKKSDPWESHMMHFGKKSYPWESQTMHFGKKSDPWESQTLHFGKKSDPWEFNTMHFGKKSDPWESQTMHFGKKSDPWESQTMHFGKKSDPWESHTMHFGKKRYPWDSHNTMHFGKRFNPWDSHNTMHFGKKADSWESHNTMHFGKRNDPSESHNTMHFGKRSNPWDSHNTMHFGKRNEPWESHTMHFGKRAYPFVNQSVLDFMTASGDGNNDAFDLVQSLMEKEDLNEYGDSSEFEDKVRNYLLQLSKQQGKDSIDKSDVDALKQYLLSQFLKKINLPTGEQPPKNSNKHSSKIQNQFPNFDPVIENSDTDSSEEALNVVHQVLQKISNSIEAGNDEAQDSENPIGFDEQTDEKNEVFQANPVPENDVPVDYIKLNRNLPSKIKRYWAPFQGPRSIVYPHAWFASQIRRSVSPAIIENSRVYETRMAEKKEDPVNSFMHFGKR